MEVVGRVRVPSLHMELQDLFEGVNIPNDSLVSELDVGCISPKDILFRIPIDC